jgi:urate oxidase
MFTFEIMVMILNHDLPENMKLVHIKNLSGVYQIEAPPYGFHGNAHTRDMDTSKIGAQMPIAIHM